MDSQEEFSGKFSVNFIPYMVYQQFVYFSVCFLCLVVHRWKFEKVTVIQSEK